jgi:hypothetical protein
LLEGQKDAEQLFSGDKESVLFDQKPLNGKTAVVRGPV